MTDTDSNVDALEDTRDVTEQSALDPEPFGFSSMFVFVEQFLVIYDELIENFILALAAVAVLSILVLGKVGVVVLVCFTVVSIYIYIEHIFFFFFFFCLHESFSLLTKRRT